MLKSYAVALVLASATPVAIQSEESVKAPVAKQATASTTSSDTSKNGQKTGKNW